MMSWLEGRLPKWGPFGGGSTAVLEREETPEAGVVPDDKSPQLMVLVNDASGMACFKTHTFPDAQSATDFLLYWFRDDTDGFSAFWAMTEEPTRDDGTPAAVIAEPLVIIKDAERADVVYSFSFVDIESAQEFVRDEVDSGTDAEQITLYWAVAVRLATNAQGQSMLRPSVPPGVAVEEESEAETADIWAAHDEPAAEPVTGPDAASEHHRVLQEAPNAHSGVANGMSVGEETFELTSWIERARRKPQTNAADETPSSRPPFGSRLDTRQSASDTEFEPAAAAGEAPFDLHESIEVEATIAQTTQEPALASEARSDEGFVAAADEPPLELIVEKIVEEAADFEREDLETELFVEDATIEAPRVASVEVPPAPEVEDRTELDELREEGLENPANDEEADVRSVTPPVEIENNGRADERHEPSDGNRNGFITLEPSDLVVHTNGHSKVEPVERPAQISESPEATIETEAEQADDSKDEAYDIRIDIHLGSSRAMKVKRFDVKEKPFDGFKSPPGRF